MHSQRNHQQNEKTINRMGENIYKWSDWQRIHHQNIQTASAALCQNKNPVKKLDRFIQTFLKRTHTNGQKHTKRCSTSLIIREMQDKITMTYYLTLVRLAIIKRITYNMTYMWNLKKRYKWNCLQSRKRVADVENKRMVP